MGRESSLVRQAAGLGPVCDPPPRAFPIPCGFYDYSQDPAICEQAGREFDAVTS